MDTQIETLASARPSKSIKLVGYGDKLGLYASAQKDTTTSGDEDYVAVLTAYPVGQSGPIAPATINLPCLLPVPPAWAISLSADNTGDLAMSQFGGGWNTLEVATIANGTLTPGYSYTVEETYGPRFVLSTAGGPPKQQVVSARLS